MLLNIRAFIKRHNIVSNQQVAREFALDLSALEPMMNLFLRKNWIVTLQTKACKTRCNACTGNQITYYQFNQGAF